MEAPGARDGLTRARRQDRTPSRIGGYMADTTAPTPGTIGWADLTVPDAERVRDFYAAVTGWVPQPLSMGEYADYVMTTPGTAAPVAGICHARGANADLPPVWLVYISVPDLDASLAACRAAGGALVVEPRGVGGGARYAVIRDPAGAVVALHQAAP
jgi:predicted enzyme related to lactoylglutathione lyase